MEYIKVFGIIGLDVTIDSVKQDYAQLKDKNKVCILIDSVGGSVDVGYQIRNYFISLGKDKLETHIIGECYSIASVVALCAKPDKRFMKDNAFYMLHLPFLQGLECVDNLCNADYLEWTSKMVRKAENRIIRTYQQELGTGDNEYWKDFLKKELYLDYENAKNKGLVSGISDFDFTIKNENIKQNKSILFMDKKQDTLFSKIVNAIKGLLKAEKMEDGADVKNLELTLDSGEGIYIETEDGDLVGKMVYSTETKELLADGSHILSDGRVIEVSGGVILSITEIDDAKPAEEDIKNLTSTQTDTILNLLSQVRNKEVLKMIENSTTTKKPNANVQKNAEVPTAEEVFLQSIKNQSLFHRKARKKDGSLVIQNSALSPSLNYTYNGIEDLNKLFYQPTLETPEILRIFTVMYGVKSKEQLFRVLSASKVVKKDALTCAITETGTGTGGLIVNRTLNTVPMRVRMEECADIWMSRIFQEWLKTGFDRKDLSGTQLQSIILDVVRDAIRRDFFRIFSWGKVVAPSVDYNQLDGLWTTLIAGATANEVKVGRPNITALNNTAGTTALDYLREVYEKSSNILKSLPVSEKAFFVTVNIYENLMTQYEARIAELAFVMLTDGTTGLTFRGIPVYPQYSWSEELTDTANPYNATQNTFILYTTPKNHVIGVDGNGDEQKVKFFYSEHFNKNIVEANFILGYNYANDLLSTISYGLVA